jgi:aldose 1-epimerase
MQMTRMVRLAAIVLTLAALPALAQAKARYSVTTLGDVVQLRDSKTQSVVSVLTPVSNAYEFVVKGHNTIRMTVKSVDELRAAPGLNGVPLLAPFANRLDQDAFYANGQKYNFDMELGNVRGAIPIHGFLSGTNRWKVVQVKADATGAWITSKLEFTKYPDYMKQFPFAHTLTMTYKLSDGALEVHLRIDNLGAQPMPAVIGYHPYFALTDSVRSEWTLDAPVKTHWLLNDAKIPTGETETGEAYFGGETHGVPISRFADRAIDDVFSDLARDDKGRGTVTIHGAHQSISLIIGPKLRGLVLYSTVPTPPAAVRGGRAGAANPPPPVRVGPDIPLSGTADAPAPPDRGFFAMEPYAGITDSMNLAQKGIYKDLQTIAPGDHWEESFWIKPSGY